MNYPDNTLSMRFLLVCSRITMRFIKDYIFLCSFALTCVLPLSGQADLLVEINLDFEGADPALDIDQSLPENTWERGVPDNAPFYSGYQSANALCTGLTANYPPANYSSFQVQVISDWFGSGEIEFMHRYNTEPLIAGGYVELSYNQGKTWHNIIYEGYYTEGYYSATDTVFNGEPAFTGSSDQWQQVNFRSDWYALTKGFSDWPPDWGLGRDGNADTLLVRFSFLSSDEASGKSGWLIDDLKIRIYDIGGMVLAERNTSHRIWLNNDTEQLFISTENELSSSYSVLVFDMRGRKMCHIEDSPGIVDVSLMDLGVFVVVILDEAGRITERIKLVKCPRKL